MQYLGRLGGRYSLDLQIIKGVFHLQKKKETRWEKKHMKSDKERSNGRDIKQIWYIQQEFSTSLFTNFIQKVCFFSNGFDFWCIYIKCDYSHFYHQNKSLYIYTVYNLFSIAISKQIKIHSCINIFYFCLNCILGQIKVEGKTSLLILPHLKRDQNR